MGGGNFPQMGGAYPQMGGANFSQMDIPDAHWRTLIANKHVNGEKYTGHGKEAYRLARVELRKQMLSDDQRQALTPFTDQQLKQAQDYSQAFGYACSGRRFFTTRDGRLGLGPHNTEPGDSICIFYNGSTPYIIRRQY
jgi:hypothetical protein